MKAQKNKQQLEKFSIIFMQLGLLFALFISYVVLEHKSEKKYANVLRERIEQPIDYLIEIPIYTIEKVKNNVKKQKEHPFSKLPTIIKFSPVISKIKTKVSVLKPKKATNATSQSVVKTVKPLRSIPKKVKVTLKTVEQVPVYPGCKGTNEEKRICFEKKLRKFVARKYNGKVGEDLISKRKKQRVRITFKINKNGNIEILNASSKYKKLEKEAIRVLYKLPRMTPGKNNGKPVDVIYTLPITIKTN